MPQPDTSFEQAQSVPVPSSASRPKVERVPSAPGAIHSSADEAPGAARLIPPSVMLPTKSVPSRVEVRLSGKARSPGSVTTVGAASAPTAQATSAPATAKDGTCPARRLRLVQVIADSSPLVMAESLPPGDCPVNGGASRRLAIHQFGLE